jgi:hypothetical protein
MSNRRHLLAISSLLNEVSIDPIQHLNTTKNHQLEYTPLYDYSPLSSGSSSPDSCIIEPPDLWSHSTTGMHQALNGNIIISSLAKGKRKRILSHQYDRLMQVFKATDTPSSEIRRQLAEELDMTKREVQVNFSQNFFFFFFFLLVSVY